MAYPILAANETWYKGVADKATITKINIVDNYIVTGNETESWNADVDNSGSIKCYIINTDLIIAGNGSGMIAANSDSSWLFSKFGAVVTIKGCDLLDCSNVTTFERAFQADFALETVDVSKMVSSTVTSIIAMFQGCSKIKTLDVSKWDTSNVENALAFLNMPGLDLFNYNLVKLDVSNWNVSKCKNMSKMFNGLNGISVLNLSNWDTSNVENMSYMFNFCQNLQKIYVSNKWNTDKVTVYNNMFSGCVKLVGAAGTKFNSANIDYLNYAIPDNGDSAPGYFTYLGETFFVKPHDIWMIADAVRDLKGENTNYSLPEIVAALRDYPVLAPQKTWYKSDYNIAQITNINIANNYSITGNEDESWAADVNNSGSIVCYRTGNTLTLTPIGKNKIKLNSDSSNLFAEMSALTAITGLDKLDASGVETFEKAFYNDISITEIDISTWRMPKVINTNSMFGLCINLTKVILGNGLKSLGQRTFYICNALTSVEGLEKISSIGDLAFFYTPNLTACDLKPERIKTIGISACRMSSIEDGINLNSIPENYINNYATRLKRWGEEGLQAIKNIQSFNSMYFEVPNPDSQLNYPKIEVGNKNGEIRCAKDWGCAMLTLYHIWNALYAGKEKQYDNWLNWYNNELNKDETFADNYDFSDTAFSNAVSSLGWTLEKRVYVESEEQLETILTRLKDGPVFMVVNSLSDGVTHAITIIGWNSENKKLAILDSAVPGHSNGLISWLAYEDIFVSYGDDNDNIRLINYNLS